MGGLILRHLLQLICNSHAITQLHESDSASSVVELSEQVRYATAIYPRVSLLNHSCEPNILTSFQADSRVMVVKSSRQIPAASEISNCYGPHHLRMGVSDRRRALRDQYHFECTCAACLRQASQPLLSSPALACLSCHSRLTSLFHAGN